MELSQVDVAKLQTLLHVAGACGLDQIVISDNRARGLHQSHMCVLMSTAQIPNMGAPVGIMRLGAFRQRLDLFKSTTGVKITTSINPSSDEVLMMEISDKNAKAQFRCSATKQIKVPKVIADEHAFSIVCTAGNIRSILDAIKAMGSATVELIVSDGKVRAVVSDVVRDQFEIALDNPITNIQTAPENNTSFVFDAAIFSNILRQRVSEEVTQVNIGVNGTLNVDIQEHTIYILPTVTD